MQLEERMDHFLALPAKEQLDRWEELLSIGKTFNENHLTDMALAQKIAESILYHRSLMGSSKAYEGATEIDVELCAIATPIARIAYGETKPLIDFLKSEIYYSNFMPERFNKEAIEKEITAIHR